MMITLDFVQALNEAIKTDLLSKSEAHEVLMGILVVQPCDCEHIDEEVVN